MTTINNEEIQKFSRLSKEWWNPDGKFKPLHKFNPVRIAYILDMIYSKFKINPKTELPLKNLKILDIGCGGGLVSEPLSRLGAKVTGIDASEKNIQVAKIHAEESGLKINYQKNSPEQMNSDEEFDIVLNLEVVEHVDDIDLYLKSCMKLVKKNGMMFVATINRTVISFVKAIVGAEYILRWLPIGTHDWNKFLKPEELETKLKQLDFTVRDIKGLSFNPIFGKWKRTDNISVNYFIVVEKN